MKQLSTVLNMFLVGAFASFYGCQSTGNNGAVANSEGQVVAGEGGFQVAFVNTDSLLLNYNFAKEVNEKLMGQEEASRAELNEKGKVFQQDAMEFQRKVQNNAFLSMDRAQKEQERLAKAERDLQGLQQKLTSELMKEQDKFNRQLNDSLRNYLKEYAKDHPYKLILSNTLGDNVLYSAPGVDITNEIIEALNKRYEAAQPTK